MDCLRLGVSGVVSGVASTAGGAAAGTSVAVGCGAWSSSAGGASVVGAWGFSCVSQCFNDRGLSLVMTTYLLRVDQFVEFVENRHHVSSLICMC